jgi:hypothetical protein
LLLSRLPPQVLALVASVQGITAGYLSTYAQLPPHAQDR